MVQDIWNKRRSISMKNLNTIKSDSKQGKVTECIKPVKRTLSNSSTAAISIVTFAGKHKEKSKGILARFFEKKPKKLKKRTDLATKHYCDIQNLFLLFPCFPKKMMICLYLRNDGNCYFVYNVLISKGWVPSTGSPKRNPFQNCANSLLTVPYFYGEAPSKSEIKRIFHKAQPGSFITFYRKTENAKLFSYVLCSKKASGRVAEKKIDVFEIPSVLFHQVALARPINDPRTRNLSWLPLCPAIF